MLGILVRRSDWVTAGYLADHLGVTPRSVRSYVTAINQLTPDAIESGPLGYRATSRAATIEMDGLESVRDTPRERSRLLVRRLLDSDDGVDVLETALEMHVSTATVEGDLRRIRELLRGTGLAFRREAAVVFLDGSELARRRFIGRIVHDEIDDESLDPAAVRRAAEKLGLDTEAFVATGRDLVDGLSALGYSVNELVAADIVVRIAVAADRASRGHPLDSTPHEAPGERARIADLVGAIALDRFGVALGKGDVLYLASLAMLSIVDPESGGSDSAHRADPEIESAVERAVDGVVRVHGVSLARDTLITRLALHVQNVRGRAEEQLFSRNPMTRSLKAASPLVFEMAVAIANDLSRELRIDFPDAEITDIAMHLGTAMEFDHGARARLTATLVCPGMDAMRRQLREHLERSLGGEVIVTELSTSYDPDWASFETDLVLTTVDPPAHAPGIERTVVIPPFLAERDVARITDAANRVRRQRRLATLRAEIQRWFVPGAFVRDISAVTPDDAIRALGGALRAEGIVDDAYIESALERERVSSTAFTESLAVPHAMTMSATRTAIAVGINEHGIDWQGDRVHVVAFVAFSESDRPAFQTVFEQLVDVFADPANARRITRRATDLQTFLTELAALIDEG